MNCGGDMQDGMLAHYLEQARGADANVEARIERERFDFKRHRSGKKPSGGLFRKLPYLLWES
jgi:hypothetical protein